MEYQGVCKELPLGRWVCEIGDADGVGVDCDAAIMSAATKMVLAAAEAYSVDISRRYYGEKVKLKIMVLCPFHQTEHRTYELVLPMANFAQITGDAGES